MFEKSPKFQFFLLFLSIFNNVCCGWDQIQPPALQQIFPFIPKITVEELRTELNGNNTLVQELLFLDDWIHDNWVSQSKSSNANEKNGRLVNQQYTWELAIGFVAHRNAVKRFIQYLKGSTRVLQYLEEKQIQKMSDRFWRSDLSCGNVFNCTRDTFLTGINSELGTKHENVTGDLTMLADVVYKFPIIKNNIVWKFEV